ncbi:MAG: hypothetical protein AAB213_05205 [Candidatus Omnitrophota bacterium]
MKNKLFQIRLLIGLAVFTLIAVSFVYAQSQAPKEQKPIELNEAAKQQEEAFTVESISGEVSGITKNSVSIIYNRDYDAGTEYEMLIPINEKTSVKHIRSLAEIKVGDLVSVEYEKPAENSKRKAMTKTINFIQSGVASLATRGLPGVDTESTP